MAYFKRAEFWHRTRAKREFICVFGYYQDWHAETFRIRLVYAWFADGS